MLDDWESLLIDGWNHGWLDVERRVASALSPLLGATPDEVACTDSTTVNLFQALVAAARLRPDRSAIVVEEGAFPTDGYAATGVADLLGLDLRVVPRDGLAEALDEDVAAVTAGHVDYRTGHRLDLAALTAAAHDVGALVVADLAHAAGAIATELDAWDVDLAVGCTYKFLNGGPGGPGWIYANRAHHDVLDPAIRGWFGHAAPFTFATEHRPADGAGRFRNGTPPILSMVAVAAALEAHVSVTSAWRDQRARELTTRFLAHLDDEGTELELLTPRDPSARGAQLSFRHDAAFPIVRALHERWVVADHRPPDIVRLGFSPLVVSDDDVDDGAAILVEILRTEAYKHPRHHERGVVP